MLQPCFGMTNKTRQQSRVLESEKKVFFEEAMSSRLRTFVLQRGRRQIPPPADWLRDLKACYQSYGRQRDSKTKLPLFDPKNWKQANNILKLVECGYVSDPVNSQLYSLIKTDKYGLKVYRCCRGTNGLEGGVHQNMAHRFRAWAAGPWLTDHT